MKKKRDLNVFSLSFLDCISCGFGAVLLLFVITLGSGPDAQSQAETESIDPETLVELLGQIQAKKSALAETNKAVARLVQGTAAAKAEMEAQALQTKAPKAVFSVGEKAVPLPKAQPNLPIGIPVEDNHLVFVIDTSGSMRNPRTGRLWAFVTQKVVETLDTYPIVKKIQVLDADGQALLKETRGRWMEDSPSARKAIKQALNTYTRNSASNPVPGVLRAIKDYGSPREVGKKVGLYIFGDEFTQNATKVLRQIDAANPSDAEGKRLITINAVGFPHVVKNERRALQTGVKFANLMRELTYQHGGAFIGMEQ